ncbi:DUF1810 domain-containing protein [Arthrobacter sp. LjRoot78]|uniref:DUF1810 domain-containing protein n=1 Tax=Arthrobacter sp. LjRoot78 TaxID=3342338 RepID=UPI003ECE04DD
MEDPFDLARFVQAQNASGTYQRALDEISNGSKQGHWMWFIFPQIAGLGQSATSRKYAVTSLAEAKAYGGHPVLGPRLLDCSRAVAAHTGLSAVGIFGGIDARKLQSSMTLFLRAAPDEPVFQEVLDRYFGGSADPATDRLLG